ncbi:MAG: ATP synthase epsilon chain [Parcubacteria group bacterium Gr01-1014_20]|nr:MAG: ATP synthase epsilon chain [Parcubacteria group bacterium Gr01-1014_20]
MLVKVISLKGINYEGEVDSVNINTESGEITILDNHRPLITVLKKGTAKIIDTKNQTREIEIKSGFLEVHPSNKVSILID